MPNLPPPTFANPPIRQVRAVYADKTIRVYQAYSDAIADTALCNGRFGSPAFKMNRMTWIKPSFMWMMYRSGWGLKDDKQARILAIDISRDGFDWALEHSCLSHPEEPITQKEWQSLKQRMPVRVQWDPERDLLLRAKAYRTIQIGLSKEAVELYVETWTKHITDVTQLAHEIHALVKNREFERASELLPMERPYPYLY